MFEYVVNYMCLLAIVLVMCGHGCYVEKVNGYFILHFAYMFEKVAVKTVIIIFFTKLKIQVTSVNDCD